jgi:hypothetical protein
VPRKRRYLYSDLNICRVYFFPPTLNPEPDSGQGLPCCRDFLNLIETIGSTPWIIKSPNGPCHRPTKKKANRYRCSERFETARCLDGLTWHQHGDGKMPCIFITSLYNLTNVTMVAISRTDDHHFHSSAY